MESCAEEREMCKKCCEPQILYQKGKMEVLIGTNEKEKLKVYLGTEGVYFNASVESISTSKLENPSLRTQVVARITALRSASRGEKASNRERFSHNHLAL
ncbi:unnamed protein product [Cuscuta europaea]|uniref:Uncharacterized protein n=1 Tax=Cuscuta europaea TaxID=41803 RepID=A0A9P1E9R7_CUSEU|nr:unnamed protein product [Cuscuta europaea]